jgi:hypothetical protein
MILEPNESVLADNASAMKDQNFGGNREFTEGVQQKAQDYKKPVGGSSNIEENPVEEVTRDTDEMTDSDVRKREFSRRAETQDHNDHNKERFPESEPENRPPEDTTPVAVPDDKYHGDKLKYHFGEGQYEGEIR